MKVRILDARGKISNSQLTTHKSVIQRYISITRHTLKYKHKTLIFTSNQRIKYVSIRRVNLCSNKTLSTSEIKMSGKCRNTTITIIMINQKSEKCKTLLTNTSNKNKQTSSRSSSLLEVILQEQLIQKIFSSIALPELNANLTLEVQANRVH